MLGQNHGQPRPVSGLNPFDTSKVITMPIDFIVSRGGDYFFSPSISALTNPISA
jgi:hypothetical protein